MALHLPATRASHCRIPRQCGSFPANLALCSSRNAGRRWAPMPRGLLESSSSTSGWQNPGRRSYKPFPWARCFLVVGSEVPEILNLPWELLLPPEGEILGINPLFRIRRYPSTTKQMATFSGDLRSNDHERIERLYKFLGIYIFT